MNYEEYYIQGFRVNRLVSSRVTNYDVFPFEGAAEIYCTNAGNIVIPAYGPINPSEAESIAKTINLCVRAVRETNTGMKKTVLDKENE